MNILSLELPFYLSQSNFNFRCSPVHVLGPQPKRQGLKTLKHGGKLVCSNNSHLEVLRPEADGDFELLDNDIRKSRRLHLSLEAFSRNSDSETCFLSASLLSFTPSSNPTVGRERTVIRSGVDIKLLAFYSSSRLAVPTFSVSSG